MGRLQKRVHGLPGSQVQFLADVGDLRFRKGGQTSFSTIGQKNHDPDVGRIRDACRMPYMELCSVVGHSVPSVRCAVYEALVVHPAWSRKPPESFVAFMGTPVGRMNLAGFWIPVGQLFALNS
jgi:hypothetical protein